ncbi:MAG: hypothetical protein QUV07_10845 [Cyanobium sp. CZS 25K]|nr:hypothetical protein [Cyanobium sp. CZS25K]
MSEPRVYDEFGHDADYEISMAMPRLLKRAVVRNIPSADKCSLHTEYATASSFGIDPLANNIDHKWAPMAIVPFEKICLMAKGKTHRPIGFSRFRLTQSMLLCKSHEPMAVSGMVGA